MNIGSVRSEGSGAGPDLVSNGGFADGTDWTAGFGVSVGGGVCNFTASNGQINQIISTSQGSTYETSYDVTVVTGGSCFIYVGGQSGTSRSSAATYTEDIVAGATDNCGVGATGFTGSVDNIVINLKSSSSIILT
jgi:hypothetical protein